MTTYTTDVFESETCSRCAGSGHYSYCQSYGTKCFRCAGHGRTLTKKGMATRAWMEEQQMKSVQDIKPGDMVRYFGMTVSGRDTYSGWGRVIELTSHSYTRSKDNGVTWEEVTDIGVRVAGAKGREESGDVKGGKIRVHPGKEGMESLIARALEFQATLTKAGTVRKRRVSSK